MAVFSEIALSDLELAISIGLTILAGGGAFLIALWYWGKDRELQIYDNKLQSDIESEDAFSGIRVAAQPEYIATSDTTTSRIRSILKKILGRPFRKPSKIVPIDKGRDDQRKIEMIRERVRTIPGRNILGQDLVGALRNHYAYKLALSRDDVGSETVEHFQTSLANYESAGKVVDLAKSEKYGEVALISHEEGEFEKDPLNDVFLPLVEAAEEYCVRPQSGPNDKHEEIERCRRVLMPLFFGLWAEHVVGVEVHQDLAEDECLSEYRNDIRDSENWGYWMLSADSCNEVEFQRLRHLAWRINEVLEDYWEDDPYSKLYPHGESLRDMNQVPEPFAVFQKEEHVVRGGARVS